MSIMGHNTDVGMLDIRQRVKKRAARNRKGKTNTDE